MAFLSPLFLAGAAAAIIPIVLHLLKRPPEQRVRFAAVMFLKTAPVEHTSRRRLREWLLLTLRVTALVLLALAFARPFFRAANAGGATGTTVVALDTSFSMSAPGRFDRAKALAKDAVRNAISGDDVALVTFSDRASVVVRPTPDRATAAAAIDAAAPGFGSTKYRAGLNAAGSLVAGRRGAIVVVTDLQESGWDAGEHASVPDGTRVEIRDVGAPPENLAITGLRVDSDRVIATIRNTGSRSRQVRARLGIDGKQAAETSVTVEARASADAVLSTVRARATVSATDGGVAAVTIDDPAGIQADNVRYALISNATTRPTVLVATATGDLVRDAFYLQHALAAGQSAQSTPEVAGVSAAKLSAWTEDQVARHAVVVLLSTRGLEPRARQTLASYVAAGGGLLVAAGPDVDGDVVADVLGAGARLHIVSAKRGAGLDGSRSAATSWTLAPADLRHPIFRAFGAEVASLGLVAFRTAVRIDGPACQTLAKFTSGDAALVECAAGDGHALVVASDLNNQWNDFPLRASFVPFVHEMVRYLSTSRDRAGEYVVGDVPAGVPPVPGVAVAPSPRASRSRARGVVVNVDSRESDPSRISTDEFQAAVTQLKDAGAAETRAGVIEQESAQHLWQFLLAAMVVTLAVEGVFAARSA
jgi:aerotolerance regulator-like protein/VWA domain-containing protein